LKHSLVCLLVVLLTYAAYSTLAVPLLEPSLELASAPLRSPGHGPAPVAHGFGHLFPPDAWELDRPKVLETDRGTLIFDDYRTLPKGRLQLNRCALLLQSPDSGSKQRRPFVLRAPGGAMLFFDGELNIPRGEFGKLLGGELAGEVTIHSPPTAGQGDGLEIRTRDVRIEERRIWTPREVVFQYGPHRGTGSDLSIVLHPPEKQRPGGPSSSNLGRIRSLELVRVDQINLLLPADKLTLGDPAAAQAARDLPGLATPVDITCEGSLRFDFEEQVLSLNRAVDVMRHNSDGPSDQLNCEQLLIYFQPEAAQRSQLGRPADARGLTTAIAGSLNARRIVAIGSPVTLRANSVGASVRAEQLEFDFVTRRIWIQDRHGMQLRNDRYEVNTTELEYEMGEAGRLGRMWAAGPGRVIGLIGPEQRRGEAVWSGEARLQPFDGAKVLSLVDQVRLTVAGTGDMSADELHLFLVEAPQADAPHRFTIMPDRMKALGHVQFGSPRLSGSLQEANLWFVPEHGADALTSTPAASAPSKLRFDDRAATSDQPLQRLHVTAQRLNAEIRLGEDPQVIQLAAKGEVHCQEASPTDQPATNIDCDVFQLVGGDTDNPEVTLLGRPARVAAQGSRLIGETMHIYLGANVAAVDGPGEMTLPSPRDAQRPLSIAWQQRMRFDGQKARFDGQVTARGTQATKAGEQLQFHAWGETLDVLLTKYVHFQDAGPDEEVGLRELLFGGQCLLESHTLDPRGLSKSFERMQIQNLRLDHIVGQLHGDGPGWLTSVHHGQDFFREGQLASATDGLHFLRVDFERELVGDVHRKQMQFLGHVRSIYGPVSSWDAVIPGGLDQLGPRDVMVTSQRLALADLGPDRDQFDALELEATGNALVRGQSFTASGQRVSYVKSKDQLVIEGDGRNYAILTYQQSPQATPAPLKARKILFWPETKQFELNDFHSLDLQNLSQLRQLPR